MGVDNNLWHNYDQISYSCNVEHNSLFGRVTLISVIFEA